MNLKIHGSEPPRPTGDWFELPPLPGIGVAGAFVGMVGDALVVAGGANFPEKPPWEGGTKRWHTDIWMLDHPEGKWVRAGELPAPRGYGAALASNGSLLCAAGSDSDRHHTDCWEMRRTGTDKVSVKPVGELPAPLANPAWASHQNRLLIVGGQASPNATQALADITLLESRPGSVKVKALPSIPGDGRILAWAGHVQGRWWVGGGAALAPGPDGKPVRRLLRDCWTLHPDFTAWDRRKDTTRPIVAPPNPVFESRGELVILPGDDGTLAGFSPPDKHPGFPRRTSRFHLSDNRWQDDPDVPFAQVTTGTARWRGMWVVASGEIRPGVRSPKIWAHRGTP